ncbi:MAG: hypothetical protein ABJA74_11055 [Lapillicoccus sp.]
MPNFISSLARRPSLVVAAAVAVTALLGGTAYAGSQTAEQAAASSAAAKAPQVKLHMQPSSAQLAECFPHAESTVTVDLTTDAIGKDRFRMVASGLKPRTDFTVFLIEKAGAPFGAVEYIGDFTTDAHGKASNTFNLIVEEAFAFNNETQVRQELNSVGFWFADPKDDDGCLGAASPVTQFDGDASAGVQMMNSGPDLLP